MTESIKKIITEKLPALPGRLETVYAKIAVFLKKPETRKRMFMSTAIILGILLLVLLVLWAMGIVLGMVRRLVEQYGFYLLIAFFVLCWFFSMLENRKNAALEKKKRQLAELYRRAEPNYKFLRNFVYSVLTQHFCQLTSLCRPLTPNLLTENPPFDLDQATGVLFFFFKAEKESTEPLPKGAEHIAGLLQSVITQRMETTGIEGICSATTDPLCSVIAVHKVEDLGSYVRITLVFDDDAYSSLKKNQDFVGMPADLVEHLR